MTGTMVLDCDGLSKAVLQDRVVLAHLAQALRDEVRIVASAATLVEARDPKVGQARFDWACSRVVIQPVTEDLARAASRLLAARNLAGHRHAIDAMVAATAIASSPPRIVLTSDPQDLAVLCGPGVRIARI